MALSGRERLMRKQEEERKRRREERDKPEQYKGGQRARTSTPEKRERGAQQARETWDRTKRFAGDSLKFGNKLLRSLDLRNRVASEGPLGGRALEDASKDFAAGMKLGYSLTPVGTAENIIQKNIGSAGNKLPTIGGRKGSPTGTNVFTPDIRPGANQGEAVGVMTRNQRRAYDQLYNQHLAQQNATGGVTASTTAAENQVAAAQAGSQKLAEGQPGGGAPGGANPTSPPTANTPAPSPKAPTGYVPGQVPKGIDLGGFGPGAYQKLPAGTLGGEVGFKEGAQKMEGIKSGSKGITAGQLQTALGIFNKLMSKKNQPDQSWFKPGAGPGSTGTDWYNPNWYA